MVAACLFLGTPAHAQEPARHWTGQPLESATVEISACCPDSRGKVHNPDAAVIVKAFGMAARRDRVLWLKLDDNRALRLTDCLPASGCNGDVRVHRMVDWWPKHRVFVVAVYLYEAKVAYLVSQRTGRILVATEAPVLSPSGRLAIALESNHMSGVDLELLDVSSEPPTLQKIDEMPNCRGAGDNSLLRPKPVWIDDSQVRFDGVSPGANPNTKQLLRIIAGKPRWEC